LPVTGDRRTRSSAAGTRLDGSACPLAAATAATAADDDDDDDDEKIFGGSGSIAPLPAKIFAATIRPALMAGAPRLPLVIKRLAAMTRRGQIHTGEYP